MRWLSAIAALALSGLAARLRVPGFARALRTPALCAMALLITLSASSASAEEPASELALLESFLAQPSQAQLRVVAEVQSEADLVVAPYMDNPVLMVRQEQGIGPGSGFSTSVIGAEFTFDVAGKYDLRKESARVRSELHKVAVRIQLLRGTCALRQKVLELDHLEARRSVLEQFEERYEWLLATVTALAKGMEKSQFDVGRATWRLDTYRERIAELLAERSSLRSEVAARIGNPVPEGLKSMIPETLTNVEELLTRSEASHPEMVAARIVERAGQSEERLAKRSWMPDLGAYGAYRIDAFETGQKPLHGYEFGLTMALPFFKKGDEEQSQARAATAVARLDLMRRWQSIRIQIKSSHAAALARVELLRKIANPHSDKEEGIWKDGVRAYKEGVVVLGELVEMLQSEESRALARVRIRFEARGAILATYCAAGIFPEQEVNDLLSGVEE